MNLKYTPQIRASKGKRIIIVDGSEVGWIIWELCRNDAELSKSPCSPFFLRQFTSDPPYPVCYLQDLVIFEDFKRRGYGTAALRCALHQAANEGAATAFLRVGWYESDTLSTEDAKNLNLRWYMKEGFLDLQNEDPASVIPFRWRDLRTLNMPEIAIELREVPESSFESIEDDAEADD